MKRLACLSVDLDEVHHYLAINGLDEGQGMPRHAVYDVAIPRFEALARELELELTFFAVGQDAERADNADALRRLSMAGHEIANHSLEHRYDLSRLPSAQMHRQVAGGGAAIERAVGRRPIGFRAPGYVLSDGLVEVLNECKVAYDSSVFPCPWYYSAKSLALVGQRLRGRRSASLMDTPSVLAAPRVPYRLGRPYTTHGGGLLELPIQVTPRLRLPYIGTALTLGGPVVARWLTGQLTEQAFVNLELHGIDLLEAGDGLEHLARHQPDLRVPLERKRGLLAEVVTHLRRAGFQWVRLDTAAEHLNRADNQ